MSSHKKRERTQNWTQEEKILLLKLCGGRISILENKKADQYSLTIKNNVWKDIHREFIAQLGTDRDILRLKEQWQRMKKQARSELQDLRTRSKKYGEHMSQFKKISNISEEVLKIMDTASKSNHEEEDGSYTSSESSVEQDNIPTYFCETEVKQEQEDSRTRIFTTMEEDSQSFTGTTTPASVINNNNAQAKSKYNNRRDTILNILADICQNENNMPAHVDADANRKRKHNNDTDEFHFLQTLFQSKNKEHQKRMQIIEEQLKTAKIQRETAEIQKQIAQQELKQTMYQISSVHSKEKRITATPINNSTSDIVNTEIRNETTNFQRLNFHQSQIHFHEEEIEKHRQQIEDLIKREH